MTELDILYHGEIQVLGWGESRNQGKYLKIRLWDAEGDPLEPFRGLDTKNFNKSAHILNATISKGDIIDEKAEQDEYHYGKQASKLYKNGFFYAPPILKAIGTDEQFRKWIQRQPSAISDEFSEYVDGEGRCEAAHVRRASDSGTGYKPEYACIPLTHDEHQQQHQKGEESLAPREWFEKKRNEYVIAWAKETLLKILGYSVEHGYLGFRDVPPRELYNWCLKNQLTQYLPAEYKP